MYPVPVFLTPLPEIPFINEEIIGCTIEAAKAFNIAPINPPSCFLFHVLLFQQHHQLIHQNLQVVFNDFSTFFCFKLIHCI